MISKSCKYAIRAVLCIASRKSDERMLSITEIAKEIHAPNAFTAKIAQTLARHKIITSLKGPYGGFYMEKHQAELPLITVVNAIDGLSVFNECGLGLSNCSGKRPCPIHNDYKIVRERMFKMFNKITAKNLSQSINKGSTFINNL